MFKSMNLEKNYSTIKKIAMIKAISLTPNNTIDDYTKQNTELEIQNGSQVSHV